MQTLGEHATQESLGGRAFSMLQHLSRSAPGRQHMPRGKGLSPHMPARIIVTDHSELFARGLTGLLTERGYEVLGIAVTSDEALALAAEHPDGLVLVDEAIDGEGAAVLISKLLGKSPRQPTIVMNGSWSLSEVVLGLGSGAVGVIDKSCTPEHLFAAIDIVTSGGMVFSSEAVEVLRDQLTEVFDLVAQRNMRRLSLTEREMEVLQAAAHVHDPAADRGQALRLAQDHPEQRLVALPQARRLEPPGSGRAGDRARPARSYDRRPWSLLVTRPGWT